MTALNIEQPGGNDALARDRAFMVARHLEARGIADRSVLDAMGQVPREAFVSEPLTEFAYEDSALPIEAGQTISQPYIAARMIELAELKPGDKVLEVGAGSGYAAAVMSRIAREVYAIERHEELATQARARAHRRGGRAVLPHHVLWRRSVLESTRRAHVRYARARAGASRTGLEGRGLGSQLSYRRCCLYRDGPSARRAQYRSACACTLRRELRTDRLRHRPRYGRCGIRLGRADGDQRVRPARDDSYEGRSRDAGIDAFFLETAKKESVREALAEPLLERAIGVIYRPETEFLSHYFQAELSRQFNAWIWFTETDAVAARPQAHPHGPDETYPFGL